MLHDVMINDDSIFMYKLFLSYDTSSSLVSGRVSLLLEKSDSTASDQFSLTDEINPRWCTVRAGARQSGQRSRPHCIEFNYTWCRFLVAFQATERVPR